MLSGLVKQAWRSGGEQWKSWGSMMIKAVLHCGRRSSDRIHVICCYAPTFSGSRTEKDNFFSNIQTAVTDVPIDEPFVILGISMHSLW